jgi:hypothetical protein
MTALQKLLAEALTRVVDEELRGESHDPFFLRITAKRIEAQAEIIERGLNYAPD